ncbi:unnamed protein product, partial [Polarella glacialis]
VDVAALPSRKKGWTLRKSQAPWRLGRQHQLELLTSLVPDPNLCGCIARSHLELHLEAESQDVPVLRLQQLSQNPLFIDGKPLLAQCEVLNNSQQPLLRHGSELSFARGEEVFLTFKLRMGPSDLVEEESAGSGGSSEPVARPASSSFALVCDSTIGCAVKALPIEARAIPVQDSG